MKRYSNKYSKLTKGMQNGDIAYFNMYNQNEKSIGIH